MGININPWTMKYVYLWFLSIAWFLQFLCHFVEATIKFTQFYTKLWVKLVRYWHLNIPVCCCADMLGICFVVLFVSRSYFWHTLITTKGRDIFQRHIHIPCQTSKMECFVNVYKPLTIFVKSSILDVWQGFQYAPVLKLFISSLSYRNQSVKIWTSFYVIRTSVTKELTDWLTRIRTPIRT